MAKRKTQKALAIQKATRDAVALAKTRGVKRHSSTFMKRTCQMYHNHKRRAGEAQRLLDFTVEDLRGMVLTALSREYCPYCRKKLTEGSFGCDHKTPVCRGGGYGFANLEIVCMRCNTAKGPLDQFEFRRLVQALSDAPTSILENTLARLRAGGSRAKYKPSFAEKYQSNQEFGPAGTHSAWVPPEAKYMVAKAYRPDRGRSAWKKTEEFGDRY